MDNHFESLKARYQTLRASIDHASAQANQPVLLVAVSKTKPIESIRALHAYGQNAFGENYWQEMRTKQLALEALSLEWHFIGHIQSRKARDIGRYCQWVHTVDRVSILEKLHAGALMADHDLQVCIQVNISQEPNKNGIDTASVATLANAFLPFPRLVLRGLMAIPAAIVTEDARLRETQQRAPFARLRHLRDQLKSEPNLCHYPWDTLSMGMSEDYLAAIAEGANLVRVGSTLFGKR